LCGLNFEYYIKSLVYNVFYVIETVTLEKVYFILQITVKIFSFLMFVELLLIFEIIDFVLRHQSTFFTTLNTKFLKYFKDLHP